MSDLEKLREKIQDIDKLIIEQLAHRQVIVKEIGQLKAKTGQKILDIEREQVLTDYHYELSISHALEPEFVKRIFEIIILESKKRQKYESL